jgi:hypothetical protein
VKARSSKMLSLGFGGIPEDPEKGAEEDRTLKMIRLLEEHGWSFSYGRDPVLILIEIEEIIELGEFDED